MTYQEIIKVLGRKYEINERDCERIVDSQFRLLCDNIQQRQVKVINVIGLGKFTPIKRRLINEERYGPYKDKEINDSIPSDNRRDIQEDI